MKYKSKEKTQKEKQQSKQNKTLHRKTKDWAARNSDKLPKKTVIKLYDFVRQNTSAP